MSKENRYYIVSIMEAAWKMNNDLSLIQLLHSAALRAGYYEDEIQNCDDKQLAEGLHRLIVDDF
mgnify:FL=1